MIMSPPNEHFYFHFFSDTAAATSSSSRTFVTGPEVLSAEVNWARDVMEKHGPFNSCTGNYDLCFQTVTLPPGSPVGMTTAYLTTFSIAPHFSSLLVSKAKSANACSTL